MSQKELRNYKTNEDLKAAYEEGGKAIGKMLVNNPEQEAYLWKLLKDVKIWPRWYLMGFQRLYRDANRSEYQRAAMRRSRQRKRLRGLD